MISRKQGLRANTYHCTSKAPLFDLFHVEDDVDLLPFEGMQLLDHLTIFALTIDIQRIGFPDYKISTDECVKKKTHDLPGW